MTYPEAIAQLAHYRSIGAKFGLHNITALLQAFGNPEKKLCFIHIAGTNGKGSTAAFLHQLLVTLGYNAGLYTSPHLLSIRERIRIGSNLIPQETFARLFCVIHQTAEAHRITPTFFETLTLLAILYFSETQPDFIVWETGLGGRLDATNVVTPILTLITPIGYDHQEFLGDTLAAIAGEKAGIIKPCIPVALSKQEPEAHAVLISKAQNLAAPIYESHTLITPDPRPIQPPEYKQPATLAGQPFTLSLRGHHQIGNAALALQAALLLPLKQNRDTIIGAAQNAFASTEWHGRLQILPTTPITFIDGAHNRSAIEVLVDYWKQTLGLPPARLIFSALGDKDLAAIVSALRPITKELHLVSLNDPRAARIQALQDAWTPLLPQSIISTKEIPMLLQTSTPHPTLITGSLRLVSEVLVLAPHSSSDSSISAFKEHRLNDLLNPIVL
jgi:dihydrofolate synthase/folylpolyglutamate synthase